MPWGGQQALWFPHQNIATALAKELVNNFACGIFIGLSSDTKWLAVLTATPNTARWKLSVLPLNSPPLTACFFDATENANIRKRKPRDPLDISDWVLSPVPNFNHRDPLPLLLPRLRPPDVPPPNATRPAKNNSFLSPALPLYSPPPGVLLPQEVQATAPLSGPYNVANIVDYLRRCPYPVPAVQTAALHGLKHGFGHVVPTNNDSHFNDAANLPPLKGHETSVRTALFEGTQTFPPTHAGPYTRPPVPNKFCSHQPIISPTSVTFKGETWAFLSHFNLLMKYPKQTGGGKRRILKHGSYPRQKHSNNSHFSLNSRQRGPRLAINYNSAADLKTLLTSFPEALVLTFDIRAAYNTLTIAPEDLWAFVIHIKTLEHGDEYFTDLVQPFGTLDAEQSWQLFAAIFMWLLRFSREHALFRIAFHYVDNIHIIIPRDMLKPNRAMAQAQASSLLKHFLSDLNIPYHEWEEGTTFPSLGFVWNSSPPSIALKEGKHALGLALLLHLQNPATILDADLLDKTLGLFSWASTYMTTLSPYVNEIRFLANSLKRSHMHNHRNASANRTHAFIEGAALLHTALERLNPDNPIPLLLSSSPLATPAQTWRCDAGTTNGAGGVNFSSNLYFTHPWGPTELAAGMRTLTMSSTFMEALGALLCVLCWLPTDSLIVIEVDSKCLADAWTRGSSNNVSTDLVLRQLRLIALEHRTTIVFRHIHRRFNRLADALSELDLEVNPPPPPPPPPLPHNPHTTHTNPWHTRPTHSTSRRL